MKSTNRHIIIIGGNAAGMSAASRIRRNDPNVKISVFEKSNHVSYAACGLPYFISDDIHHAENLIAAKMDDLVEKRRSDIKLNHEAKSFDSGSKTIRATNLATEDIFELEYDKLIITTGARPLMPDIPGRHLDNIFALRTLGQGIAIKEHIDRLNPKNALIIGGGYVGLEMAEALRKRNIEVTIVELRNQLMGNVDPEISDRVEQHLLEKGCKIIKSDKPIAFIGDDRVEAVQFQRAEKITVDMIIVASGILPNVEFAASGGVVIGKSGAIAVNSRMQTNKLHVYAAGDCAEVKNIVTGKNDYIPLGTTANKQGRSAGDNVCGKINHFKGVTATAAVKVFNLEIARTGISEQQAVDLRLPYKKVIIDDRTRAPYYPGSEAITVLLLFDVNTGRLLGSQILGHEGSAKRIDVLAAALYKSMTVKEIAELDLSYAPPFAPAWDPILIAANQAVKLVRD